MRVVTTRAMLAALVSCGTTSTAQASGGGGTRDLSSTTVRPCPRTHKLEEHYYIYGSAYAAAETIEIACLRDPTFASWIFLAKARCDDSRKCTIKQLAFPAEHVDPKRPDEPRASPRTMIYMASRYSIGEDCKLESYRENDDGRDPDTMFHWSCRMYVASSPDKPLVAKTTGATTSVDDDAEGAANLPLRTTQPAGNYTDDGSRKDEDQ